MKDYIPKVGERVEAASRFVEMSDKLLDVGCGDGVIQHFITPRVKSIYGVDNSNETLKKAKKRGIKVKVVDLDRQKIPFKTNYFDVITCLDVIEHVRDPKDLLTKIHRVLKKNGKLIITTPNIRFTNHIYDLVVNGVFPKTSTEKVPYDGGHIHFLTYTDMINLIKQTGYSLIHKDGIINKRRRGWKGRILELILGKDLMLEFRAPGILLLCQKL
jgi:methionine biosynthesis protein MetW